MVYSFSWFKTNLKTDEWVVNIYRTKDKIENVSGKKLHVNQRATYEYITVDFKWQY